MTDSTMNDASSGPPQTPPAAAKRPSTATHHGITVSDDYAWLRDKSYPTVDDPEILAHLDAENAWFEAAMAGQQDRIDALFTEMRGRIKEADTSVPQKDGNWLYWIEYEDGAEYKKWWRKPVSGGPDELLLDEVAAHLDPARRAALFDRLAGRGQVWMTGTEDALFDAIDAQATRIAVGPG